MRCFGCLVCESHRFSRRSALAAGREQPRQIVEVGDIALAEADRGAIVRNGKFQATRATSQPRRDRMELRILRFELDGLRNRFQPTGKIVALGQRE